MTFTILYLTESVWGPEYLFLSLRFPETYAFLCNSYADPYIGPLDIFFLFSGIAFIGSGGLVDGLIAQVQFFSDL